MLQQLGHFLALPLWPAWSVNAFLAVSVLALVLHFAVASPASSSEDSATGSVAKTEQYSQFKAFQRQYLLVMFTLMFADWLQGTHMYTLYDSYNKDDSQIVISTLFLTGFWSSAVFGTFMGSMVDQYGRKLGCIVYILLEIAINLMEHVTDMRVLLVGRVLGGISTSLLFTAFESWMVTEHRRRGFPEQWMPETFALSATGNGITAIVAGVVAQLAADAFGDIGPFQVAIALTALALLPLMAWPENYADSDDSGGSPSVSGMLASPGKACGYIWQHPRVMLLGGTQALFEGSMFTFVFMWVPSLFQLAPEYAPNPTGESQPPSVPVGLVFSSLMVCITIGGIVSRKVTADTVEVFSLAVYLMAAAAMAVPAFVFEGNFYAVLLSFCAMEVCVGAFMSSSATLRSMYLPSSALGSIMSMFRVPLNMLVVIGTKMTDSQAKPLCFGMVAVWLVMAFVLQACLIYLGNDASLKATALASSNKTSAKDGVTQPEPSNTRSSARLRAKVQPPTE